MTDSEYLIHLLYCAVNGTQPAEAPESVSFERVLAIGKAHEVANIAFFSVEKLQNKPEPAVYDEWQRAYFFSVQRDVRQQAFYEQVTALLHENGIRTLEAQGTVTKTLYPSSEWRMMSDIDLIIDRENLAKAHDVMATAGYEVTEPSEEEFNAFSGDLEIEFHTDFFTKEVYGRKANYAKAVNNAFSHAHPDDTDPMKFVLEDAYFYLFSVLHTVKHFETAGCGIRRVLDLYYLKKAFAETVDTAWLEGVLAQYGFLESYETLSALEAVWFEGAVTDTDLGAAACSVLLSGTHGTRTIFSENAIRAEQKAGVRLPALQRIRRFVFPTKEWIYENYPICRERGYSAARSWCYRLFHKLKEGKLKEALAYIRRMLQAAHGGKRG